MTEEGLNLIMNYEGFSLVAYKCPAGRWTIGYGNTLYADGTAVKEGDKIDQATANQLFKLIVADFEKQVKLLLGTTLCTTLPAKAVDALVSFAYNCGVGSLAKSTLLKTIKADKNNFQEIEKQFLRWNKANGKELKGLTRRRQSEANMYIQAVMEQYSRMEIYNNFIKCNYK